MTAVHRSKTEIEDQGAMTILLGIMTTTARVVSCLAREGSSTSHVASQIATIFTAMLTTFTISYFSGRRVWQGTEDAASVYKVTVLVSIAATFYSIASLMFSGRTAAPSFLMLVACLIANVFAGYLNCSYAYQRINPQSRQ